jgi:ketol-acid reductoisomerase
MHKPTTNGFVGFDLSRAGNMTTPDELQFLDSGLATFIAAAGRNFNSAPLWQNNASQAIFLRWMAVFDTNRAVLNGDIVHVKRPDGRNWDAMMHVLPTAAPGAPRGFAIFYNPTASATNLSTALGVYYCGFEPGATVRAEYDDGSVEQLQQDAGFSVRVRRAIPARGYTYAILS